MDRESIMYILKGDLTKKIVKLTLALIVLVAGLFWQREYFYTLLISPIHINSETETFLTDRQVRISDLQDIEMHYIAYVHTDLRVALTERTPGTAIYGTYIGDKLVLCDYPCERSEAPEVLSGKEYKCYCKRVHNIGYIYEIQDALTRRDSESSSFEMAEQVIQVLTVRGFYEKQLRAIAYIALIIIVFGLWIKNILIKINLKHCKTIKNAVERYGDLENIFQEIQEEECLHWNTEMFLTTSWFVHGTRKEIIKCEDIAWLYHKTRRYWVVEYTWTTVYTKDYKKYRFFSWGIANIFYVYDKILDKYPEIVRGYSKSMKQKWKEYQIKGGVFKDYIELN